MKFKKKPHRDFSSTDQVGACESAIGRFTKQVCQISGKCQALSGHNYSVQTGNNDELDKTKSCGSAG